MTELQPYRHLEDRIILLEDQLKSVMGDDRRLGILMQQGMTHRQAVIPISL